MHTRMISFLLITLCKFVNKTYILSHDMRKNMVSERGGGADKKKKKKKCLGLSMVDVCQNEKLLPGGAVVPVLTVHCLLHKSVVQQVLHTPIFCIVVHA